MPAEQKSGKHRQALKNYQPGQPGPDQPGGIAAAANAGQLAAQRQQQQISQNKEQKPADAGNPGVCVGGGNGELIDAAGAAVVGKLKAGGGVSACPQGERGVAVRSLQHLIIHGDIVIVLKNLGALQAGLIGHGGGVAAFFQVKQRGFGKGAVILIVLHGNAFAGDHGVLRKGV